MAKRVNYFSLHNRRKTDLSVDHKCIRDMIVQLGPVSDWTTPIQSVLGRGHFGEKEQNLVVTFFYGNSVDLLHMVLILKACSENITPISDAEIRSYVTFYAKLNNEKVSNLSNYYYYNVKKCRALNLDGTPHVFYTKSRWF
jgi:hypothetical protein